ncbi:M20 family metallopeptidase [Candidatus Bipolaricaulota bacterium]
MSLRKAFERAVEQRDYVVDILRRIIAVDNSIPPGSNYHQLLDVVEPEFRRFGLSTERVLVPQDRVNQIPESLHGERANLVASLTNGKPKVSVYAHMDTVPVDNPWSRDPFGGEVANGRIYGRGAEDMKGAIACLLGALKVMHEMDLEPSFEIDCLLCTDEEVGIYPGARYLAEEGYFSNHLLWLELGAMAPISTLGTAGSARIDITGVGRSCHSGMNYLGINAIEEMLPVMQELVGLKAEVQSRESATPSFPLPAIPSEKMTPMFSITVMRGGGKDNTVPGECTITVNRRYIIEEAYADVVEEIEQAIERGRARSDLLDVRIEATNAFYPVSINPGNPAAKRMRAAVSDVLGYTEFLYGGLAVSTDLGFVIEALKPLKAEVACCGLARPGSSTAHAVDESVLVNDLVAMTKLLLHYFCA